MDKIIEFLDKYPNIQVSFSHNVHRHDIQRNKFWLYGKIFMLFLFVKMLTAKIPGLQLMRTGLFDKSKFKPASLKVKTQFKDVAGLQ